VIDQGTAQVLLGLFGVLNTGLLVYQAVRLQNVHAAVNSARDAAVDAAHTAGVVAGLRAGPARVGDFPAGPVGETPTPK
jgi:hypothetical protein